MATLDSSIEAILSAIVETLETEMGGGELSDVLSVKRGDRARPMPDLPAVWVIPQRAQFRQDVFGSEEGWALPVSIAALVKSDNPDTGGRQAQSIAARARAVALAVRPAGVDVLDVLSESFDPTARSSERNRNLFWTDATIRVLFTADDRSPA